MFVPSSTVGRVRVDIDPYDFVSLVIEEVAGVDR
jgi:hypothetical protein